MPFMFADANFAMPEVSVGAFDGVSQPDNLQAEILDLLEGGLGQIQMRRRQPGSGLMKFIPDTRDGAAGKKEILRVDHLAQLRPDAGRRDACLGIGVV